MNARSATVALRASDVPATSTQLDLFIAPIVRIDARNLSLDERFERFHAANPHVYRAFVAIAREYLAATGRDHVGAKMLWEELRYRFAVRSRGESDYSLNNSYVSRMARLAAAREPDLRTAFEFRQLRSNLRALGAAS